MKKAGLKAKRLSRIKDIDSVAHANLLKAYCYCIITLGAPFLLFGGLKGFLIAVFACIPLAIFINLIAGIFADLTGKLFGAGRKPSWTIKERFQSDIEQAMFFKRQQQYYRALKKVDEILNQAPEFAEALFLKAQILWEGYDTANGARRYLNMAVNCVSPEEHLHHWIHSYQNKINFESGERNINLAQGNGQKGGGDNYSR